jgi:CheY-like chemotaxis protein
VGTGLGLFVCRNIVRDLGGLISASEAPGGGALLRVVLPRVDEESIAPADPDTLNAQGTIHGRVVIIDDDPIVATSLADCLVAFGAETEVFNDGRAALDRLLTGQSFDLAYCDLMMAGMTGMELAEELAGRAPDLLERLVFMTGGTFTARAASFAEAHDERVVEKPFSIVVDARHRLAKREPTARTGGARRPRPTPEPSS